MDQIEKTAYFCTKIHVNDLSFLRYVPQGNFEDGLSNTELRKNFHSIWSLDEEDFKEVEKKLIRTYRKYKMSDEDLEIRIGNPWRTENIRDSLGLDLDCKAGRETLEITYGGDVVPCPALKWEDGMKLGNVHQESLKEILGDGGEEEFGPESTGVPCMAQKIHEMSMNGDLSEREKRFEKYRKKIEEDGKDS